MAEIGMEAPKIGLGQKVREAFTRGGAEQKWMRQHQEMIRQYAEAAKALPEDQRAQVMASIENDATQSAKIQVRNHWLALAGSTALLTAATVGVIRPDLVSKLADKLKNVNIKGHNFGLGKVGEGLHTAAEASHNFLRDLPAKAVALKDRILKRGTPPPAPAPAPAG